MTIFKSHIDAMGTYKPPLEGRNPEQFTLLDFNERTVPISNLIVEDLVAWLRSGRLQVYPAYGDVVERIAEYAGVDANQLMITNGSDQAIDLVFRACCEPDSEVIIPAPSFPIYSQAAQLEHAIIHQPHYSFETGYPVAEVLALINEKTRVIVVSNPNNPSGTVLSAEGILSIAGAAPNAAVLVDECYFEYCGITVADRVAAFPNIIVTRTFSKTWGLSSLRFGYLVSAAENIRALLKVRGPYDVNQLAVVAVKSALKHQAEVHAYIREVMERSKPKFEAFLNRNEISYWPSEANFIWLFMDNALAIETSLRAAGILVRPKTDAEGRIGLRVSLGTEDQTDALIAAFESCL